MVPTIPSRILNKFPGLIRLLAKVPRLQSILSFAQTLLLDHLKDNKVQVFVGFCPLCAKTSLFLLNPENPREWGNCLWCFANSRYKVMGSLIQKIIRLHSRGIDPRIPDFSEALAREPTPLTLKAVISRSMPPNYTIFEPDSRGTLHNLLQKYPRYIFSEFFPQNPLGTRVNGILNEDLQRLTFHSNQFDLILTQDVFEHIQDPFLAFREIKRVLKPGGIHLFTVPLYGEHSVTRIDKTGKKILPDEYHSDHQDKGGALVFSNFGHDLLARLEEMGFKVFIYSKKDMKQGICGLVEIIVSIKRE